jgi:hypothetical protein
MAWRQRPRWDQQPRAVRRLLILENLTDIERWRAGLDDGQRRRFNHPNSVWMHWRRSLKTATPAPASAAERRQPVTGATSHGPGKAVHWSADHIRRGAAAYRDCRSNDVFTIVRAVLEAAVRSQHDLAELLNETRKPAKVSTPAHAAAVHA